MHSAHARKCCCKTKALVCHGLRQGDLLRVLALRVLVVLDEAYVDFSTEPSRLDWVLRHDNLVVLRTFSKSAGLAGPWKHARTRVHVVVDVSPVVKDLRSSCASCGAARATPRAFCARRAAPQRMYIWLLPLPLLNMRRAAGGLRRLPKVPHHLHVARKAAVQCVGRLRDGGAGSAHQPGVPRQGEAKLHIPSTVAGRTHPAAGIGLACHSTRHPWHAQLAGTVCIDHVDLRCDAQVRSALMEERERLFAVLQQFDFLEPYPSQANFILCSVRAHSQSTWLA
jgi:Aminotransferase class I and II